MGFQIAEAFVSVKADSTGLREETSRAVNEAGAGQDIKVGVKVQQGALGGLMSNLAPFLLPSIAAVGQLSGVLGLVPAAAGAAGLAYGTLKVGVTGFADALKTGNTPAQLKAANEALADLSPNARAAAVEVRSLGPAWQGIQLDVQNRLFAGTSQVIQQVAKTDLPVLRGGMDGMAGSMNVIIKYFGSWATSSKTVADLKGIMGDASTATGNLGRALQPVLGILRDVAAVGSSFLPSLSGGFATSAQKVADFVSNARDTGKIHEWIQTGIDAFSSLWQVIKNVVGIFVQIATAPGFSPNMISALATVTGWILKLIQNVPELIPIIESALVLWKAWTIAQWAVNAAMDANPITLIVIAIAALVAATVLIVTHWQQVKAVLEVVWNWIKDTATAIFNAVKGFIVGIWTSITDFIMGKWNALKDGVSSIFGWVRDFLAAVWTSIKDTVMSVWNAITDYFTRLWNAHKAVIMPIYNWIRDFLAGIWNSIKDTITSVWNAISSFFSTIWNGMKDNATAIWNAIVAFFTPAFTAYRTMFETAWNAVKTVFTNVWNGIKDAATAIWNGISGFFTTAFDNFKGFFSTTWNGIVDNFNAIWGRITGIAQTIWNGVTGAFRTGVNDIVGLINKLVDGADVVLKFLLIPLIPHVPLMAAGGVMGLAGGGTVGKGFTTNGPMAVVGEGNPNHPEYVIRSRCTSRSARNSWPAAASSTGSGPRSPSSSGGPGTTRSG
jgi:phage-related protein